MHHVVCPFKVVKDFLRRNSYLLNVGGDIVNHKSDCYSYIDLRTLLVFLVTLNTFSFPAFISFVG